MQHNTQPLSASYPSDARVPYEHEYGMISPVNEHPTEGGHAHSESSDHHKSVIGIVKEKAQKLKKKIKKHKEHGHSDESSSAEEDEDEDENGTSHQVMEGNAAAGSVVLPPLEGAYLIPDPNAASVGSGVGVHEAFGNLSVTDKEHLQQHVPSAAGQASAGVTPYLAAHGFGGKAPEGSNGQSLNAIPPTVVGSEETEPRLETSSEDSDKTELSNKAAGGQLSEKSESSGETGVHQEGKTMQEHVDEDITNAGHIASTTSGKEPNNIEPKKSMLEHAKERIFGSTKLVECSPEKQSERKPSITTRAADTMISLKDAVVSKLGYGVKSSPKRSETREPKEETSPTDTFGQNFSERNSAQVAGAGSQTSGSTVEKIQESASQLIDTMISNVQKVQAAAVDAEETLASKLGYETKKDATRVENSEPEQESAAAGNITGELGSRSVPSEGTTGQGSVSAERFHPGEEDRALSQLITEKLTLGASTIKGTLMRPFGSSKSRPSTPITTPPPAAVTSAVSNDEAAITAHETPAASEVRTDSQGEKEQGLTGKVGETVSSFLGTHDSQGPTEPGVVEKVGEVIRSMLGTESASEKKTTGAIESSHEGVCEVEMNQ